MIRNPDEVLDRARRIMRAMRLIKSIEVQSSYDRQDSDRNSQRWELFHDLYEELERTLA